MILNKEFCAKQHIYSLLQGFENASLDAIHVILLEKVFPFDRHADIHNKHFLKPGDVSCTRNYHQRLSTKHNFDALHFKMKIFFAVKLVVPKQSLNRRCSIPYITGE